MPARVDLTDGKLYTLSDGTKKVLRNLQTPVKVKLYISQGESVPVPLRSFAQRVEDLVREFKSVAGSNLIIEHYNPRPDSEEEDAAAARRHRPAAARQRRAVLPRRHGHAARPQADHARDFARSASACSSTTWCAPSRASAPPSARRSA